MRMRAPNIQNLVKFSVSRSAGLTSCTDQREIW